MADTTIPRVTLTDWLDALADDVDELASGFLGVDGSTVVGPCEQVPNGMAGAYVPLMSDQLPLQIGLASTPEGCNILAASLMGMSPEEAAELDEGDMVDALGEIVNILAGMVKTSMAERDDSVQLGLPMFIHGRIAPMHTQEHVAVHVRIGSVEAILVAVRPSAEG